MTNWLDRALQRAIDDGLFDNLSGAGKPLNFERNPYEDPNWRTAHRILRQSGETLPWIADRQTLVADIEKARQKLAEAWVWRQQNAASSPATDGWNRAVEDFSVRLVELNRRIRDFNLKAPVAAVHLHHLDVEQEIRRIQQA